MIKIGDTNAVIPGGKTPGRMLTVELIVTGVSPNILMDIETLNHSTRHHASDDSYLQMFHVMCHPSSTSDQITILTEIGKDTGGFYDLLCDANDAFGDKKPLMLFRDHSAHEWPPVAHSMAQVYRLAMAPAGRAQSWKVEEAPGAHPGAAGPTHGPVAPQPDAGAPRPAAGGPYLDAGSPYVGAGQPGDPPYPINPCLLLMVSGDPTTGYLLDGTLTACMHP